MQTRGLDAGELFAGLIVYFSFLFFHLKLNNLGQKRRLGCIASVFSNILIIGIRIIIGAFGKRSGLEAVPEGICVCVNDNINF